MQRDVAVGIAEADGVAGVEIASEDRAADNVLGIGQRKLGVVAALGRFGGVVVFRFAFLARLLAETEKRGLRHQCALPRGDQRAAFLDPLVETLFDRLREVRISAADDDMGVARPVEPSQVVLAAQRHGNVHALVEQVPDLARIARTQAIAEQQKHARLGHGAETRPIAEIGGAACGIARDHAMRGNAVFAGGLPDQRVDSLGRDVLPAKRHEYRTGAEIAHAVGGAHARRLGGYAHADTCIEQAIERARRIIVRPAQHIAIGCRRRRRDPRHGGGRVDLLAHESGRVFPAQRREFEVVGQRQRPAGDVVEDVLLEPHERFEDAADHRVLGLRQRHEDGLAGTVAMPAQRDIAGEAVDFDIMALEQVDEMRQPRRIARRVDHKGAALVGAALRQRIREEPLLVGGKVGTLG